MSPEEIAPEDFIEAVVKLTKLREWRRRQNVEFDRANSYRNNGVDCLYVQTTREATKLVKLRVSYEEDAYVTVI